jgi:hypothetical protein
MIPSLKILLQSQRLVMPGHDEVHLVESTFEHFLGIFWFHVEAGMLKGICWATGPKSIFGSGRHWGTIRV